MAKTKLNWGKKARQLKFSDICRGKASYGKKRDLRGWIIEFFGEHTRAGTAFENHISKKIGILSHDLEFWSDDAIIKEQVRLFNETLLELDVHIE